MITLYGIKNCDTMKKTFNTLQTQGVDFVFHDFRKQGLDRALLLDWEKQLGWQNLINKRGMTWRKLDDTIKNSIDRNSAIEIMLDNPAIIKRPLIDNHGKLSIGFNADELAQLES